jgi:hypothetical protein
MYEALGLAMQADGRSVEEIERTVMSAMDFVDSPAQMMYIGLYMSRIGLDKRALQIYRQVSQVAPLRAEPYLHGLALSKKLGDLEGIQWSTMGILRQAWPKEHLDIWAMANRMAKATLDQLEQEKRTKERDAFQKALDEAVIRDVVVKVTWNGDADVDVLVEEPSGTICSARNNRSTAGGVMLGDTTSTRLEQPGAEGASEFYVCSEGFDGTYRVLIRRVWGKVTAGRVNVEIFKHYRNKKQQQYARRTISLDGDEAVVAFDLENGRREESLKEHQVANAAVQHLALRQEILGQQLNALANPAALGSLAMSRAASGGNGGGANNALFPFLQGGVGYQPIIITLPEGTNFTVTGVVSADRRYVRVTCVPLFSRITDVRIFNYVSGNESQGNLPNTGGGGFTGSGF